MTNAGSRPIEPEDALFSLFAVIASGDVSGANRLLDRTPDLATRPKGVGASRENAKAYFLQTVHHHIYAGDTALHVAAAAYHRGLAESLVARGSLVGARNRRGEQPLHYASDGRPGASNWDPDAQADVISFLVEVGADPDATDKSGVAPLHRAVRTRSAAAVEALIDNGADPRFMNKSGSTPVHLAVQNTGKSNSGSDAAKEEQRRIILLLLARGAHPSDRDANGKTVAAAASSDWVAQLLADR